tara:strand:+ start:3826 stop:4194 length:369 start_codon:yes stop_codon:yes gene_type:complete
MNPYRFALAVQVVGCLSMTITGSHFGSPGLSIGLFMLSWLPILSFMGTYPLWRPWWLDQTELPDTRPVWLMSAAWDTAAIVGALLTFSPWEILAVRLVGALTQLSIVGRAPKESEIKNHERN